ncbi:hypothetical protein [Rhizocola hellebori]|uniref:hypothetical protein n=1 Tax=Rhizocola hellebori TaxID=1392758 RepID=UPI001941F252|nr:hypothetical protein [Rhizocola hellebori]
MTDPVPSSSPVSCNPFHAGDQPAPVASASASKPTDHVRPSLPAPLVFSHDPARLAAQGGPAQR